MQKLLAAEYPGQLFSPEGNPVDSDRTMALNKWVLNLNENAPRVITLTGIGRPTFPVNEKLTNAAMRYWGTLAESAAQTRRDIKKFERARKLEQEQLQALADEISETDRTHTTSADTAELPNSPTGTSPRPAKPKQGKSRKKTFRIPFDKLKKFMAHGLGAVHYSAPAGDREPREVISEALSRFYKLEQEDAITPNQVIFTVGGASALYSIFQTINSNAPNGRIITTNPYYSLHAGAKHSNRLHTIDVMKLPGYRLTAYDLKSEIILAKERAKLDGGKISAIVLSYPNNPTGQVLGREEWEQIAEVLREDKDLTNVRIVLDEAYAELQMDGNEHFSLFQVAPDLHSRIALIRCGTKGLSAAGERMGVVICKDPFFMEQLENFLTEIHGHAPKSGCHAYAAALDELSESEQARLVGWYAPMVEYVTEKLKIIGASMPDPNYKVNGTFYVMADLSEFIGTPFFKEAQMALPGIATIENDEQIVYHLLFKEQIMVAPLSYFGVNPKYGYIRITCSDVDHVEDVIKRLANSLRKLREEKCESLYPKIEVKLNELNQVAPQTAAELVNHFNQLGLGSFKITKHRVYFVPAQLSELDLKRLNQKLSDLVLTVNARIKRESSSGRIEAAIILKGFFRKNIQHKKSERFFEYVHKLWCLWVDNFIEANQRTATKRLPPMDCIKTYPKWAILYKTLHAEFVQKGFDSLANFQEFDFEQFAKKSIECIKQVDASYLVQLENKIRCTFSRTSATPDDVQSSASDDTPQIDSDSSSMSSSPSEDNTAVQRLGVAVATKRPESQSRLLSDDPAHNDSLATITNNIGMSVKML